MDFETERLRTIGSRMEAEMRIMISQPMRGLTREQIEEGRAAVVSKLTAAGYEIVDSFVADETPVGNAALACLGKSFQIMAQCDAVYFMSGWEKARGCWMEYHACRRYGIRAMCGEDDACRAMALAERKY